MKTLFVKDLKPGSEVTGFFVLRKKELKEYDGRTFLKLEMGDRSGRIDAVVWDNSDQLYDKAEVGEIVKVEGCVTTYKGLPQLKVDKMRKAKDEEVNLADFLPASEQDLNVLCDDFKSIVQTIENRHLRRLLDLLVEDSSLMEKFKRAPGGKLWHHARLGGLLEHTLAVACMCQKAAEMYDLVNRDLLITGALVHDIGKIDSYSADGFFDYTDEGRLLGHVVSGDELVDRKITEIADFPQHLALKLKHLVLSHQGQLDMASPVVPKTIEAIILHYADELDAKADAFSHIIKTQKTKGKKWSDWVRLIDRFIYFGEDEEEGQTKD
jgi:3'-5' exoribonuclease